MVCGTGCKHSTVYADQMADTQRILKAMLQALMLEIARRYKIEKTGNVLKSLSDRILEYMDDHSDIVTLKEIAAKFNYHPNYISTLLHRNTGRKFSEVLLEKKNGTRRAFDEEHIAFR